MNKILLLTVLLTAFSIATFAKPIDEFTAKQVGQTFLTGATNSLAFKNSVNLDLIYKSSSSNRSTTAKVLKTTFFYVFNAGTNGFVIVAADDQVFPILGYSDEGAFDPSNIPQNAQKWFEEYKSQIRYVIDNNIAATQEIQEEWNNYLSSNHNLLKVAASVNPLVQTKWDQSPYYNDLCPFDYTANERTVSGCVATAMAQIMKFWNYPATGSGFHSYDHHTYGTLAANIGSTTFQWSAMPNYVNSSNNEVATLMYHVGVSVDMDYGIADNGGSAAFVISAKSAVEHCSEYALKTYFGYKNTLQGVEREYYNDTQWINLLKGELDASRPILYAGFGSGGGHAFVCDGYDNSNFFHFNWGWGGAYDGYFLINSLNPSGLGTGGGTGGYNSGQQAVIGIEPPQVEQTLNIGLYNYVNPSSNTIYYGQSFDITTNIVNSGTITFNGDLCAAIFDDQYNFIDFVEVLTGYSLQGGYAYQNDLVFSNSSLLSMLPGTYYVGIYYKPADGNWIQVSNNESYTNFAQMNVIYPNDIELNSSMNVTPSTTLTQGQSISVNYNIINDGTNTFSGYYGVGLYNLDGTLAQDIGIIEESNGLPPGYTYQSPYLTFDNASVSVSPGTYLLAAQHNPNSDWQLTGSSYFQNPIRVTVQAPSLTPDQYENNDTFVQSHSLPINISNNTATKNTQGSNLHNGADNDYYSINLASGYDYTISAILFDSFSSEDEDIYTVDALFSYSTDGSTWSDAYDDYMTGDIKINNGGIVYFHVAPYFAGETGSYLLDLSINRTPTTSIEDIEVADLIKIYPNPAKDFVTIDLNQFADQVLQINLLNVTGQIISSENVANTGKSIKLPLQGLADAVYFIEIHTSEGIISKKIIVKK
ncbi:MAG: hypothetical protein CVV22_05060 [Ignavibacteriae bacterium HGW-Ignavibacteriae-1]|jgi:hypothetical protein|nr:MAG: hypothetical protein CVV22_05060 [Ignavibacteriae bacterium HGW-Ignavibacteriae-1]